MTCHRHRVSGLHPASPASAMGEVLPCRRRPRPGSPTHLRLVAALAAVLSSFSPAAVAEGLRPRADGLVDDFEAKLRWSRRADGGHPPRYELNSEHAHAGRFSLRLEYRNQPPGWGSIEKRIALTGEETALTLWLYVESAGPKAAMHIWLFEKDGDAWMTRVHVGERKNMADFLHRWVKVRLPIEEFAFQPRGRNTPDRSEVVWLVINCNFDDFVAYVDDIRFELPPAVQARLRAEERRRQQLRDEAMKRAGWRRSEKGNIAIFRDPNVPPPQEGTFSDPDYLGQLLKDAGYHVTYLTASELAVPELLRPELFDLVVFPYGPRFPNEAADTFRTYLQDGGRFLSVGGYAFDEPYFSGPQAPPDELLGNGGFEEPGQTPMPARWTAPPPRPGLEMRRATDVARSGRASLYIAASDKVPLTWFIARYRIDRPDRSVRYLLSGYTRVANIHDGPGAYLGIDFYRENGSRISFVQTAIRSEPDTWHRLEVEFSVPPGTAWLTANCILYAHGQAWFDDLSLKPIPRSINTRHAVARDMLHISEDQLPVFDPSFRLQRVARVRAAEGQFVAPPDFSRAWPVKGYAAVGLWGRNSPVRTEPYARWIPILRAYDEYGHLQGTVGAAMFHHAGPWQGSAWAFFGVTDRDLFPPGDEEMAHILRRTVAHLLRGIFLTAPEPSFMCYRPGEQIAGQVVVGNCGRFSAPGLVTISAELFDAATGQSVGGELTHEVTIPPGEQRTVEFRWPDLALSGDLYEMRFTAIVDGQPIDQVSTGFVIWRQEAVARGPAVVWRDNYFHLGPNRPATFLCGTNQTGVVLSPWWENPLQWAREFRLMRDWGLRVLRVLHISHFAGDLANPDDKFLRRLDALVYMCQRYGIILFPCMHDWLGGISIPDAVLAQEARFAQILARRYKDVPGMIIDIENEARAAANDHPELRAMFNDFLRQVYAGDEAALRKTWGDKARFGQVPFRWPPKPESWTDLRYLDINLFCRRLVTRWLKANVEAMRAGGTRHAITDEYYLLPAGDAGRANKFCDFVNIHCYGIDHPASLKYYDHSAEGRGFAVGEFSRRSHPSFRHGWGWAPEPEVRRWYYHLLHAALGAGGSMACNWDWKDLEACIFPWGLVHTSDLVPKSQLHVMRAVSSLFSRLELSYEPPEVYVVVADLHALGSPDDRAGWPPARRCIDALLRCGVRFGVIHDANIDQLPDAARVIFYPVPFTLSDQTFSYLEQFLRRGRRVLYISGDIAYDERRQRTRASRIAHLTAGTITDAGPRYAPGEGPDNPPTLHWRIRNTAELRGWPAMTPRTRGAKVIATAAGEPAIVTADVAQSRVFFCAVPLELYDQPGLASLYRRVLEDAGVAMVAPVQDGNTIVMVPPLRSGQLVLAYRSKGHGPTELGLPGACLHLEPGFWALLARDAKGRAYAADAYGQLELDSVTCTVAPPMPVLLWTSDGGLADSTECTLATLPVEQEMYSDVEVTLKVPGCRRANVSFGEISGGRWRRLGRVPTRSGAGKGAFSFTVPGGTLVRAELRR